MQTEGATRGKSHPVRRWRAATAIALIALGVAACGSSSSSKDSTASGSASSSTPSSGGAAAAKADLKQYLAPPTKIPVDTPLDSPPPSGKTVVFLGTTLAPNVEVANQVQALAKLVHWKYSRVSYDPSNPATFTAAVTTALAKHPDYLAEVATPLPPAAAKTIQKAGVKIVVSSVPGKAQPPNLAVVSGEAMQRLSGKIIGDYLAADSNCKVHAIIEHVPAYTILIPYVDAIKRQVQSRCGGGTLNVVNISIPDITSGGVPRRLVSAAQADAKANYLVFDAGTFANGVPVALKGAGLADRFKIVGSAPTAADIAALKNGTETAWVTLSNSSIGYGIMDAMVRDSVGMAIPQDAEGVVPTQLLTNKNVGSTTNWNEPANILQQYKALWKVK